MLAEDIPVVGIARNRWYRYSRTDWGSRAWDNIKIILIALMYFGRVVDDFDFCSSVRQDANVSKYPQEKITVELKYIEINIVVIDEI